MSDLRKPNFFIAGAPKSGTSALFEYLGAHPNVFVSPHKEPHFFAEDFPGLRRVRTLPAYLELFSGARPEHTALGEASVYTLASQVALPAMRRFAPDARIVALLRNPLEMVPSLHNQHLRGFDENEPDLGRAWALQEDRARGAVPVAETCQEPRLLQYRELASLGGQVERLLQVFPREQVLLLLYDDLRSDPTRVWREVLGFLGLPDDGRRVFPRVNVRARLKHRRVAQLIARPPAPLRWARDALRVATGRRTGLGIGPVLSRVLSEPERPRPLPPGLAEELGEAFEPDIRRLEGLLGQDLGAWRERFKRSPDRPKGQV